MGGWVYFMSNERNGILYVGVTSNLIRRAFEHRESLVKGFTKQYGLKRLVYFEHFEDIRDAIQRETRIEEMAACPESTFDPRDKSSMG